MRKRNKDAWKKPSASALRAPGVAARAPAARIRSRPASRRGTQRTPQRGNGPVMPAPRLSPDVRLRLVTALAEGNVDVKACRLLLIGRPQCPTGGAQTAPSLRVPGPRSRGARASRRASRTKAETDPQPVVHHHPPNRRAQSSPHRDARPIEHLAPRWRNLATPVPTARAQPLGRDGEAATKPRAPPPSLFCPRRIKVRPPHRGVEAFASPFSSCPTRATPCACTRTPSRPSSNATTPSFRDEHTRRSQGRLTCRPAPHTVPPRRGALSSS